jgi:hypothetical protein
MKTNTHFLSYLVQLFPEWDVSQREVMEKIKTRILWPITFFYKSCRLWDNVEKIWYNQTDHKWQYNTAHALCMLDDSGYKHTITICNTYCFSTTKIVTRTQLNNYLIRILPVLPFPKPLQHFHLTCYSVCGMGCVHVLHRFIKLLHSSLCLIRV